MVLERMSGVDLDMRRLFFTDEETEFLFMCHGVYAKGRSGIIFVLNEEHAQIVCNVFRERGMVAKTYLAEGIGNFVMVGEVMSENSEDMAVEFVMLAYPTRELETYLQLTMYGLSKGKKGDDTQEPVILLDCVGMYHRFGFTDKKRNWDKIDKERTRCTARALGEEVSCSLMMEIDKPVRPKPYEIISTDDNGISVFQEKRFGYRGLMDKDENILCEAVYHELGVSSYGWYIGVCRFYDPDSIYSTVIDIRHGKKYLFGEIRHMDEFLYEADVVDYENGELLGRIRFNGFLKLVPTDTFVLNGITIYNVSGIAGVVTQELNDVIDSPIVKEAIINNSDVKILLDQTKFKDRYNDIAAILGLTAIQRQQIFTVNALDNHEGRNYFKEVWICRGQQSDVYGVEEPPECYWAYTTERAEKEALKVYLRHYGTMQQAIEHIEADRKSLGISKYLEFARKVNQQQTVMPLWKS